MAIAITELFKAFSPSIILLIGVTVSLLGDIVTKKADTNRRFFIITVFSTLILTIVAVALSPGSMTSITIVPGFKFNPFYQIFAIIGLSASLLVVFSAAMDFRVQKDLGIFGSLLLLSNMGGVVIASSANYIPLYVGFELMTIPIYAMVAYYKRSREATEAAMKLVILGALSSGLIIYGISLIYGATGSLSYDALILTNGSNFYNLGILILVGGIAFKLALIPFHWWVSDIYTGAPVTVVNYLAVGSKKMAFTFAFQVFMFALIGSVGVWGPMIATLAILSMLFGNAIASIQNRIMRLMAYSSIAHAGYIAVALVAYAEATTPELRGFALFAAMTHMIANVIMKGGLVIGVLIVMNSFGNDHIENFRGLIKKDKVVGWSLVIFLFSLIGIPPTAGFVGKFFLVTAVVSTNTSIGLITAVALVIGSAISVYYYGRFIWIITRDPTNDIEVLPSTPAKVVLAILALITLAFPLIFFALTPSTIITTLFQ